MAKLHETSKSPIAAVELIAVVAALGIWSAVLTDKAGIVFVDNEATKACMIRAYSPNEDLAAICEVACAEEVRQRSLLYWERVASAANPSDAPSRGRRPQALRGLPLPLRSTFDTAHVVLCSPVEGALPYWQHHLFGGLRDLPVAQ